MPLDWRLRALLWIPKVANPTVKGLTVARARKDFDAMRSGPGAFVVGKGPPVADVSDLAIDTPGGKVKIRAYRPLAKGPRPVVMYFHGGGLWRDDLCGTCGGRAVTSPRRSQNRAPS